MGTNPHAARWAVMHKRGFALGYREGWRGVAGEAALPDSPTRPTLCEPCDYEVGFRYGRADALERGYTR